MLYADISRIFAIAEKTEEAANIFNGKASLKSCPYNPIIKELANMTMSEIIIEISPIIKRFNLSVFSKLLPSF